MLKLFVLGEQVHFLFRDLLLEEALCAGSSQLAFYVNLHRAVIGPSATLTGRWRPDIDLRRMLTGLPKMSHLWWNLNISRVSNPYQAREYQTHLKFWKWSHVWGSKRSRCLLYHNFDHWQSKQNNYWRCFCLFVRVEVLRPSQPNGVMSSAVSLPNHTFTGQA